MTFGNALFSPRPLVKSELIEILKNDAGLHGEIWWSTESALTELSAIVEALEAGKSE